MGLLSWIRSWRDPVRVRTHLGRFCSHEDPRCFVFINVHNRSKRPVMVTHVFSEHDGDRDSVYNDQRPLPVYLRPGEEWETWEPDSGLPRFEEFVVRVSTGRLVRSKANQDMAKLHPGEAGAGVPGHQAYQRSANVDQAQN